MDAHVLPVNLRFIASHHVHMRALLMVVALYLAFQMFAPGHAVFITCVVALVATVLQILTGFVNTST